MSSKWGGGALLSYFSTWIALFSLDSAHGDIKVKPLSQKMNAGQQVLTQPHHIGPLQPIKELEAFQQKGFKHACLVCSHPDPVPDITSTPGRQSVQVNWTQLSVLFSSGLSLPALLYVCSACWFHPGLSRSKHKSTRQRVICTINTCTEKAPTGTFEALSR